MKKLILLLVIAATAFISCTKLSDPTTPHDRLKGILLGKDTLDMYVNQTRLLPLTFSPSNYNRDSIIWKSSDTSILSISDIGLITAKKVGASTISVSNLTNTVTVSCLVTVSPAPIDSLKTGLIAYYPLNNNGVDSSGHHYDAFEFNDLTAAADRNGNANSAYYFGGIDSYLAVKDISALVLFDTDYTLNAWIKLDRLSESNGSVILSKRTYGSPKGYDLSITGYGSTISGPGVVTFGPGGPYTNATGTKVIDTGRWHMVTVVYNVVKKQLSIFVDGELDNVSNNITSVDTQAILYIGSDNPSVSTTYGVQGAINDIRIYNRALPVSQLQKLYKITN